MAASSSSWRSELWNAESVDDLHGPVPTSGACDYTAVTPEYAAKQLFDLMVSLKEDGTLSAKTACIVCFWAARLGQHTLEIERLGFAPGKASTGHYSRHFDEVAYGRRPKEINYYRVSAPGHRRADDQRVVESLPMELPHEVIAAELSGSGGEALLAKLTASVVEGKMPPVYTNHVIVRDNPGIPVFPITMYIDGVSDSREDDTVGIWMQNLTSKKRRLLVPLRKSELCQCGCKGWCRYYNIFSTLRWSLMCLKDGKHPMARHDRTGFGNDVARLKLAGVEIGAKAALVGLDGDWMEWATTLGFNSWNHGVDSCPLCFASVRDWAYARGLSVEDFPFTLKLWRDYCVACEAAEHVVHLSNSQWRFLRSSLILDSRYGRILSVDVPELGLKKWDRLEPSDSVPDVVKSFDSSNPIVATFWRSSDECGVKHRNPIFDIALGTSPSDVLHPDWLHVFSLGLVRSYNGWVVWALVERNAWGVQDTTRPGKLISSTVKLRAELFKWYPAEAAVGNHWSRVQNLKPGMFGDYGSPSLALYGSEGNVFFTFP